MNKENDLKSYETEISNSLSETSEQDVSEVDPKKELDAKKEKERKKIEAIKEEENRRQKAIRKLEMQEAERMRKKIKIRIKKEENFLNAVKNQERERIQKAVEQTLGIINMRDKEQEERKIYSYQTDYYYSIYKKVLEARHIEDEEKLYEDEMDEEKDKKEDVIEKGSYIRQDPKQKRQEQPGKTKVTQKYENVMTFYVQNKQQDNQEEDKEESIKKDNKQKRFRDRLHHTYVNMIEKNKKNKKQEEEQKEPDQEKDDDLYK